MLIVDAQIHLWEKGTPSASFLKSLTRRGLRGVKLVVSVQTKKVWQTW